MSRKEYCQEQKNLMNNAVTTTTSSMSNIELFLDQESKMNKNEPWNKLDKTDKIKQLNDYVDNTLIETYTLTESEVIELKTYLTASLDKKKLQCVKDVQYDKTSGKIKTIPCLNYNPTIRKFTLIKNVKRRSATESLGKGKTIKKKKEGVV
jgi:hypothetical protein